VIPLMTLAVSIGCCDIGQGLGSKDDVHSQESVRVISSRRST
jgi:hypothetical protein